jgi:phenylacetate-coenzyme A ligase PaaK-like adenylate-forming protein
MPSPVYVDLDNAYEIAGYLFGIMKEYSRCSVWTYVSSAIRICIAAGERNLSFEGITFFVSGEPVTRRKLDEIKSTGAEAVPYYAFVEGGIAGYGCANSDDPDDMHLLTDRFAVISHKKSLKDCDDEIDALLFTSLLPESPKILLNVETGDHGSIKSRRCGCKFESQGFLDHLVQVRSFEKFTSEGMTFIIGDLVRIAEEILPEKYGGSSTDYQVLKESDRHGMSSLEIAVNPRVGPVDEGEIVKTIINELGKGAGSRRLMAEVWDRAGTIRVSRKAPIPTERGKLFSFRSVDT